jgi:hypothetical protein
MRHGSDQDISYALSISNNHVLDFGRKAFADDMLPALQKLAPLGLCSGAGLNLEEVAAHQL